MAENINYYFTDEDYEVFRDDRQTSSLSAEMNKRKEIRQKLLDLNELILPIIKERKWNLHNHYKPENITSMIAPCEMNKGRVNWLGVRYGKSKRELADINFGLSRFGSDDRSADIKGFQKYTCMQVNVSYTGLDAGMYFAVPYDSIDRNYLYTNMDKLKPEIEEVIRSLKGLGYRWSTWNVEMQKQNLVPEFGYADPESTFDFDVQNPEDFADWWLKHDVEGCYSSVMRHFPRRDRRIATEDDIVENAVQVFEELYPLYKIVSWHTV